MQINSNSAEDKTSQMVQVKNLCSKWFAVLYLDWQLDHHANDALSTGSKVKAFWYAYPTQTSREIKQLLCLQAIQSQKVLKQLGHSVPTTNLLFYDIQVCCNQSVNVLNTPTTCVLYIKKVALTNVKCNGLLWNTLLTVYHPLHKWWAEQQFSSGFSI